MTRTCVLMLCAAAVIPRAVRAQDVEISGSPDDLESPLATALTVAGVQPTSIAAPTSPRALAVDALSILASASSGLPETYAVQVSPYWLGDHPNLYLRDYFRPDLGSALARSFTVSAAVAPVPEQEATARRLAFGVRILAQIDTDNSESSAIDEAEAIARRADAEAEDNAACTGARAQRLVSPAEFERAVPRIDRVRILRAMLAEQVLTAGAAPDSANAAARSVVQAELNVLVRAFADRVDALVMDLNPRAGTAPASGQQEGEGVPEAVPRGVPEQLHELWRGADPVKRFLIFFARGIPALVAGALSDEEQEQQLNQLRTAVSRLDTIALGRMAERYHETLCAEADARAEAARADAAKLMREFDAGRLGLSLELAGGMALDFDLAAMDRTYISRLGVWATLSYRPQRYVQFLAVARLTGVSPTRMSAGLWFDYGLRLLIPTGDVTIGFEVLGRAVVDAQIDEADTFRVAGTLDARATDDVVLTISVGRDFVRATTSADAAFAVFGARFQFGSGGRLQLESSSSAVSAPE